MRAWFAKHTLGRVAVVALGLGGLASLSSALAGGPASSGKVVAAEVRASQEVSAESSAASSEAAAPAATAPATGGIAWEESSRTYDAATATPLIPSRIEPRVVQPEVVLEVNNGSVRASECCPVGGWVGVFPVSNFFQGNVIGVNTAAVLSEIKAELDFTGSAAITYGVYKLNRSIAGNTTYEPIKVVEVVHTGVGRAFYSSGILNIALTVDGTEQQPLEGRYALGVGWKDDVIDFARDADSSFCAGTVVGWWGVNANPPSAGTTSSLNLSPSQGIAASMDVCFQAPGGACCLDDATCVDDVTSNACENTLLGVYNGDFSICNLVTCEGRGACCTGGPGSCQSATQAECGALLGTYKGDGAQCGSPDPCDNANDGACCFYDGSCAVMSEFDCVADPARDIPGTFTAPGVLCEAAACPSLGACCTTFDSCTDTTTNGCIEFNCQDAAVNPPRCSGGFDIDTAGLCPDFGNPDECISFTGLTYHEGEPCALQACFGPVGACCTLGNCEAKSQLVCENGGGVFTSMGSNGWQACESLPPDFCNTTTNGADRGACCLPDGSCALLDSNGCQSAAGVFQGAGTACSSFLCTPGACCLTDSCVDTLPVDCVSGLGGTFQGTGTLCPGSCFPTGACCLPDGTCRDGLTLPECEVDSNGMFQGELTDCTGISCPIAGSCCVEFSFSTLCFDAGETDQTCADRINSSGVLSVNFATNGTCVANACDTGACCELDGTCSLVTGTECAAIPDTMFDATTNACETTTCLPRGACCTTNGCEIATYDVCTSGVMNGTYRGDGAACGANTCDRAACCTGNTCTDDFVDNCLAAGDLPGAVGSMCDTAGLTCADGACCIDFGGGFTCFNNLNQFECDQFNQTETATFAGVGIDCASDPCSSLTGSCCHLDSTCDEGVTQATCDAVGGATYVPGGTCVPNTCVDQCAGFPGIAPSDFNGDGHVDLTDYAAFQRCFGSNPSDECMCVFDANEDGAITIDPDYVDFHANYGGPRDVGACCHLNGVCDEAVTSAACAAIGGSTFTVGAACTPNPCTDQCAIFAGNPPGDFNGDNRVDLKDFGAFQMCFGTTPTAECLCMFDSDEDGAIDTVDLAAWEAILAGP